MNFFAHLHFISLFYFLYSSIRDEKDSQGFTLERIKEVESLRNPSLVTGARRVSVSYGPGRLIGWEKSKAENNDGVAKCCQFF